MVTAFPAETKFCRWNCKPGESDCAPGTVFADGCYSVSSQVVCEDGFEFTSGGIYGPACCPTPPPTECATAAPCVPDEGSPGDGPADSDGLCCWDSPVLVDVRGDGFSLTDASGGVPFDFNGDGLRTRFSWTAAGSDDAWLALDRDGNGRIDDASELFGNRTAQPPSPAPHGFLALAEFDKAERGGNADGVIDARDAVFARLRLWQDLSHDGLSQPEELHAPASLGVARLHLDYKESRRVDEHGNQFRYRAKVDDAKGSKVTRWAWDVFLFSAR